MKKNEILTHLRAAKAAHINWLQRAKLLISGFEIDKDSIPVNSTQCQFGKWFYADAQKLNGLRNNPLECMTDIEQLHFQIHDIYMKIYKIFYEIETKGFFSKLFGKKKTISDEAKEMAKDYYDAMDEVSKKLIEHINRMERRIVAVPEEELLDL